MKYCVKCGRVLNTDAQYCNGCGLRQPFVPPELLENRPPAAERPPIPAAPYAPISTPVSAPVYAQVQVPVNMTMPLPSQTRAIVPVYYTPLARHKKGVMPFLVWSLILIPFFNIIGTPLAVIAAMQCLAADADQDESSDIKLSRAAVLCIIATIVDVATLIFLFASSAVVLKGVSGL